MLLYELAIVLDERSNDVIAAGAELGLGDLHTATDLDPQQVAALRAHFAGTVVPPPLAPLGSAGTPLPAAPAGPATWGPPTAPPPPAGMSAPPAAPPGAPVAPASWGPPTPPPTWGPPPGAQPPPPQGPDGHAGPYFAYPEAASAQVVDSPLGLADATLPTPPPPAPGAPGAGTPTPASSGGLGTGQKVLIGGVVAAVLALFAFMAVNTGPDEEREQALAETDARLDAEAATSTTPPAPSTTAAPVATTGAPDAYAPADVDRFCEGGLGIATFELRLAAAIADADFGELSGLVRDRRAGWTSDVETMASGAAPILVNDIELYRAGYERLFDAVEASTTMDQVYASIDRMELIRATNAAQEVGAQISFECE